MKDLFYSSEEQIVFKIVGYSAADNTAEVVIHCTKLLEEAAIFAQEVNASLATVKTMQIIYSKKYERMRLYAAFVLGKYWTMSKWILY